MAAGDLSARSEIEGKGEIGILAESFNIMAESIQSKIESSQRFVADAAHEIYTPLTALRTNLELASNEAGTKETGKYLERSLDQASRIDLLTKGLLDLSRLESPEAGETFSKKILEVEYLLPWWAIFKKSL